MIGKIGWSIWEYFRRSVTPFFMNLMFGMTMLAISTISIVELKLVLMFVIAAADCLLVFILVRAAGENAYKMKVIGQLIRENRPTGSAQDAGTYRVSKEYRWYKGLILAAAVNLIPVILTLVSALGENLGARVTLMLLCGWCYLPPFSIYQTVFGTEAEQVDAYLYSSVWWSFVLIGIQFILVVVAYYLGATKEKVHQYVLARQTESIEEGIARHQANNSNAPKGGKAHAQNNGKPHAQNGGKPSVQNGKKGAKKH
ncbi:MAG TPA: hypothetical protein H9729_07220 [Candidatus Borkfalkia excrementigallinarum]|uniref:Sensor domain-containing protein n=1 Tax=Candidatus Borkfalkia excrementigallinarum TaxID=2838506 RepID=A0A9D1ZVX9_9FIRM|nr:hypothetical protein [Candidatus Borkfalkia excrementigallinarum]